MILTLNSQKNDKDLIKKAAANKIKWKFKGKIKYDIFLVLLYQGLLSSYNKKKITLSKLKTEIFINIFLSI